jgi:hypothetical protein
VAWLVPPTAVLVVDLFFFFFFLAFAAFAVFDA